MMTNAIRIDGPAGALETRVDRPEPVSEQGRWALLCHPHPQFGGTMADGVLQCLAESLLAAGYAVVRFNFRGVGASEGRFDQGNGETQDVLAMLQAVPEHPALAAGALAHPPLLIGYSFGAAMAWQAAPQWSTDPSRALDGLWLVAPPLDVMSFADHSSTQPLRIIVGAEDDYCSVDGAAAWLARQQSVGAGMLNRDHLLVIRGADHFFSGQQDALQQGAAQLLQAP